MFSSTTSPALKPILCLEKHINNEAVGGSLTSTILDRSRHSGSGRGSLVLHMPGCRL